MQHPPYVYGDSDTPLTYTNSLTCIKYGTQYRPPRIHNKPLVQGPQTALVTERPDKYGQSPGEVSLGRSAGRIGLGSRGSEMGRTAVRRDLHPSSRS